MIDAHCHLVRPDLSPAPLDSLLQAMDRHGVARSVLFGLPFDLTDFDPPRYTDASDAPVLAAAQAHPDRVTPFLCGFDPGDPASADYVARQLEDGPWAGVGELLLRYNGELGQVLRLPADDPALLAIYRIAAGHQAPVLLHVVLEFADELERALIACPETRFIWAHAGVSWELAQDQSPLVRALLERHANLVCDLSWILWDQQLLDGPGERILPSWLSLFADHPDRFLAGFDLVGCWDEMPLWRFRYGMLERALPAPAAQAILSGNAQRILRLTSSASPSR